MNTAPDTPIESRHRIPTWIIDDDKNFCFILSANLNQSDIVECSRYFHSAKAAVKNLETEASPPSVILLDIKMPGMSGLDAIKPIKELTPGTQIIMFTSHDLDESIRTAITNGASGYLLKSSTAEDVIRAIEEVQSGGMPFDPVIIKKVMQTFIGSAEEEKSTVPLTPREVEIVKALVKGLENIEIARTLCISRYTVETHIKNIYRKLEAHNRHTLVAKALQNHLI